VKNICELCERENVETTVHHLIPREEGGNYGPTADLCVACHKQIHALFTNKELASYLHTIKDLKSNDKMRKFLKWIKKQPATASVKIKKSNERKKRRK
jgi:5-methylcytosine-specific restriction enzyme A